MADAPYRTLMVTGAAGFVGRHLLEHLRDCDDRPERIVGVDLRAGDSDDVSWVACDLADHDQAARAIAEASPDGIVHLAGRTRGEAHELLRDNVLACGNLLAAAWRLAPKPRILVMGSAAAYGITTGEREVVDESHPRAAITPYGASKAMQERWALARAATEGLPVVCARPFNIIGPGQPEWLVPAAFLRQIANVLDGAATEVRVGNTATQRDFIDVRDVVAALWALMVADESVRGQCFNVASGRAESVSAVLEACIELAGRDVPVRRDPARLRKRDVRSITGDASKLRAATGWHPTTSLQQSVEDMWHAIRRTVRSPGAAEG